MLRDEIARQRSFASGPVLDYWLGRSEGFELATATGRRLGTVERAVLDESGRAQALVVRTALLGRRRIVATEAVAAVTPAGETLTLHSAPAPGRGHRAHHLQPARRAVAGAARTLAAGIAWTGPRARAVLVRLAGQLAALLATASAAARRAFGLLRRRGPAAAGQVREAARTGAGWTRPRLVRVARLAAHLLVGLGLLLFAVLRGVVVATWTYWTIVAREAARRRAAT